MKWTTRRKTKGQPIPTEERARFEHVSSLASWDVAELYGCGFSGDMNPLEHGGYFYDTRDWEDYGYASVVEFWWDDDNDELVVQRGVISRPCSDRKAEWSAIWRCVGYGDDVDKNNLHVQIDAVRSYCGIEPDGTAYPDLMTFRLEDWQEWRIWRAIHPWLIALGDNDEWYVRIDQAIQERGY